MAGLDDSSYVHGEYESADGKVVTADGIIRRGMVIAVKLGGDTFAEPDEALAAIDAALQNMAVESDEALLAEAARRAVADSSDSLTAGTVWHATRE
ncbi:MAG TPA: biotin--protein ligase [Gammaproteobacteria bacterium]|nr:biotin--protein ligase [Gammaproteobacteria bacterium]